RRYFARPPSATTIIWYSSPLPSFLPVEAFFKHTCSYPVFPHGEIPIRPRRLDVVREGVVFSTNCLLLGGFLHYVPNSPPGKIGNAFSSRRGGVRTDDAWKQLLAQLAGGLIVSCQALPGEPLHGTGCMVAMARAAAEGGAVAIRANGADDIRAIKQEVGLPVIGIVKRDYPG